MLTITFNNIATLFEISELSDSEIERARKLAEKRYGKPSVDPKTDYPSFTIYEDGNEIAAG